MHSAASPSDLKIALTLVGVAAVLVLGLLLGKLVRRLHQPAVIGEVLAGIVLGPSVLGLLPGDLPHQLFPAEVRPMLSAIAQVGLLLFLFAVGWGLDGDALRRCRSIATTVSIGSVALSFVLGAALALLLYPRHAQVDGAAVPEIAFVLFLAAAMSVTAFPVLARILADTGLLGSRVGAIALAAAAIDDVLAWTLLALVSGIVSGSHQNLWQTAALSAVYVGVMLGVVRPLLARVVPGVARDHPAALAVIAVAGVFLSSYASTWIGIHAIFGAFLFGVVMPREPADVLRSHVRVPVNAVSSLLLPVFFVVTGLGVDVGRLTVTELAELGAIILVACASKIIGSAVPARLLGLPWSESGRLGLLMNTRGLTELIILNAGAELGVLDPAMFTMMVIMALVTTALAGPLVAWRLPRSEPQALDSPALDPPALDSTALDPTAVRNERR